jgi:cytochrome c553
MAGIGKALSDEDRRAVADYLASLPPAAGNAKTALAVSPTPKETTNVQ